MIIPLNFIIVRTYKTLRKKFEFPAEHKYKPVLKDVLLNCPNSPGVVYSKEKYNIMKNIPEGGCWVDLPVETQKSYMGKSYIQVEQRIINSETSRYEQTIVNFADNTITETDQNDVTLLKICLQILEYSN